MSNRFNEFIINAWRSFIKHLKKNLMRVRCNWQGSDFALYCPFIYVLSSRYLIIKIKIKFLLQRNEFYQLF